MLNVLHYVLDGGLVGWIRVTIHVQIVEIHHDDAFVFLDFLQNIISGDVEILSFYTVCSTKNDIVNKQKKSCWSAYFCETHCIFFIY